MNDPAVELNMRKLLKSLEESGRSYDIEKVKKAFAFASEMHEGQYRVSGEAYISHPVAVATIVARMGLDTDSICAALLHDTIEDCSDKTDLGEIKRKFGPGVAMLVDGLTKLVNINIADKEETHIENIRKMLLAMSKDVRVIFIKLCDRLHNMRTLGAKPPEKQRMTALETMQIYAPLAHRLGMQRMKQELENLGIYYLDPFGYEEIKKHIEQKFGQSRNIIKKIKAKIAERLRAAKIDFTLEARVKSIYSIYKKMFNQNKNFDDIYDFYAIRIIVDTELACYTVLGIMHEMFNSIPGRFKDYVSLPKPNRYRSIHTTVIGRDGVPFEIQIRTWEMHHEAEYGIAAHWKYKTGERSKEGMDKKLEWIAKLVETEESVRDPDEFFEAIKTDIFQEERYIFTPKGDLIVLPRGACVIDFAYAIHSAVGNKTVGAKINGLMVPIDRVLENGQIVEVITSSSSKGPSRDWLNIVVTSEAKSKIRQWFKKEKKEDNIALGKSIVDAELKRTGRPYTDADRDAIVQNIAGRSGFTNGEDIYNALGYGGMALSKIAAKLKDEFDRVIPPEEEAPAVTIEQVKVVEKPKNLKSDGGIVVDGERGCAVKFAKCCNPLPGDKVIGFITKGYGISIHNINCPNVIAARSKNSDPGRWVEAHWEESSEGRERQNYEAILQLHIVDRVGLLADVSSALADMKVPILYINSQNRANERAIINMKISCRDRGHCRMIVDRLKSLDGVIDVVRGYM